MHQKHLTEVVLMYLLWTLSIKIFSVSNVDFKNGLELHICLLECAFLTMIFRGKLNGYSKKTCCT